MLSVCQTRDLWPNERNVDLHSYITWNNIRPSFLTRRIAGVGRLHRTLPLSTQRGAQKRKSVVFRVKLYFTWRKSATKFLCVNTASKKCKNERNACPHCYITRNIIYPSFFDKKNSWWGRLLIVPEIFGSNWPCRSENADFQSIFAHSALAVTPSEKKFN